MNGAGNGINASLLVFSDSVGYKKRIYFSQVKSLLSHMLRMVAIFFTFLQSGMLALLSARSSRIGFTMAHLGKIDGGGLGDAGIGINAFLLVFPGHILSIGSWKVSGRIL